MGSRRLDPGYTRPSSNDPFPPLWSSRGKNIPTLLLAGRVVHSSRAPEKEAARLFEHRPELRHAQVVVFLGFGLGYHLEAFLEKNHYGEAWVLEPAPEVLLHAARTRSLTRILSSDRVKILLPYPMCLNASRAIPESG